MKYNKLYKIIWSLNAIVTGFMIGLFVLYGPLLITSYILPKADIAKANSLSATCSVTPISATTAKWVATVSGGTGSVTYSWSGTEGLTNSTATVTKTYTTSGVKIGTVTITSGGSIASATCSILITIPSPAPQCSDGTDNDGDGKIDQSDPGCSSALDNDETDTPASSSTPAPAPLSRSGGGGNKIRLEISNEKVKMVATSTAEVTWDTNLQAQSKVFYDKISHASSTLPFVEYANSTEKTNTFVTKHSMVIKGLYHNVPYYFRPAAFRSNEEKGGIELMLTLEGPSEPDVTAVCSEYLLEYIKFGEDNSTVEVAKLQTFLNDFEGFNLDITGIYDLPTFEAVEIFQERYADDILVPWGIEGSTGYVYITTKKKINEIYCNKFISFSLDDVTEAQRIEIEEFRAMIESLRAKGIQVDTSKVGMRKKQFFETGIAKDTTVGSYTAFAEDKNGEDISLVSDNIIDSSALSDSKIITGEKSLASTIKAIEKEERNSAIIEFLRVISIGNFLRVLFNVVF